MTIKGEHKMTDDWSLTGAYLYTHTNEPFQVFLQEHPQLDPGWNVVMRRPKVLALNSTHVVNASTVMTLRAGWMSFPSFGTPGSADFDLASLGFPASYVNAVAAEKFPRVSVLNMGQVGGGALLGDAGYAYTRDNSYNFNGTVSKLIGRHTIKIGADFRDLRRELASLGQTAGTFNFDPGWTQSIPGAASRTDNGNSFASFLLGLPTANPSSVSSVPINTPLEIFVRYYGGYVQDDWRVSSTITVNYGLRYEWETGLQEIEDRFLVAFDRAAPSPLAATTGLDLRGGLRYAGEDGLPRESGRSVEEEVLAAPWPRVEPQRQDGRPWRLRPLLGTVQLRGHRRPGLPAGDQHRSVQQPDPHGDAEQSVSQRAAAAGGQQPWTADRRRRADHVQQSGSPFGVSPAGTRSTFSGSCRGTWRSPLAISGRAATI